MTPPADIEGVLRAITGWDVLVFLLWMGAVGVGLKWVLPIVRGVVSLLGKLHDIVDDWHGTPEVRDGAGNIIRKAKAGVLARLDSIEYEVKPNHGGSAHDAVMQSNTETREMVADMIAMFAEFRAEYARDLRHNHPDYRPGAD